VRQQTRHRPHGGVAIAVGLPAENAHDSIRAKCEYDSNVIDESDLQYEK
jgi:hypothetical protein